MDFFKELKPQKILSQARQQEQIKSRTAPHLMDENEEGRPVRSHLFGWLVADGWCWFVVREEYCWLVAGGWFVVREKYCWLVADKRSEQGE
jgi:hypothetical protein